MLFWCWYNATYSEIFSANQHSEAKILLRSQTYIYKYTCTNIITITAFTFERNGGGYYEWAGYFLAI